MVNVISMVEHLKLRAHKPAPDRPAEIIIFPGVRHERLECSATTNRKSKSRRLPSLQNQATAEDLD